ncbi:MAG: ATP synthase F1 subunit gamma [Candidatus Sericytochromatia bacterium]|nr:ATP synthase F1 subunit gamma [Candidatus Tanganyikabacteria bacterium]
MPLNTKEIRRRIRSVQSTQKITKAMEMVAAAKVRRAQDRVTASRPYADRIQAMYGEVSRGLSGGEARHPLLATRPVKSVLLVLLTSDKGLCGGYNANVIRFLVHRIRDYKAKGVQAKVLVVGTKGVNFFKHASFEVVGRIQNLPQVPTFTEASVLVEEGQRLFETGEVDAVELVYTRFQSMVRYEPVALPLLPAAPAKDSGSARNVGPVMLFEPDAETMLSEILPAYLKTMVYQALLDASASELANRMMAMGAASKNAGEMISHLTLVYNKARQAGITQEILEVVGGAEALKG